MRVEVGHLFGKPIGQHWVLGSYYSSNSAEITQEGTSLAMACVPFSPVWNCRGALPSHRLRDVP